MKVGQGCRVAIDFETYLISELEPIPRPVCLSWYDGSSHGLAIGKQAIESLLISLLESKTTIIAHNCTFETLVLFKHLDNVRPYLQPALQNGRFLCTLILQQIINNATDKVLPKLGLDTLVLHYFNEDISESKKDPYSWRLRYSELDGIPEEDWPSEAKDYAIQDSIWAYKLFEAQASQLNDWPEAIGVLGWNTQVSFYLNWMGNTGILVDKQRVLDLEAELKAYLEPRRMALVESKLAVLGKTGKITKNMNAIRDLIKNSGIPFIKTKTGAVSTTGEHIDLYLNDLGPDHILNTFQEIIAFEKAETAYISRLKQANPLLRSQYDVVKATGRTSCRTSTHYPSINIQQIPRQLKGMTLDIRNCFVARDGYKLVSIDYNGLELAAVAHTLRKQYGASEFLAAWNRGDTPADMHSAFGAKLMSLKTGRTVPVDEFIRHKKDPEYAKYRQLAKPVTLGLPGGMGRDTIRTQMAKEGIYPYLYEHIKVDSEFKAEKIYKYYVNEFPNIRIKRTGFREWAIVTDEIVEITRALFELYPDLKSFLKDTHQEYQTGKIKKVKNEWGEWEDEQMYAYDLPRMRRNDCTYTAFCNGYLMQAPSASGAKQMIVNLSRKYINSDDVHLLAFIHDEVVFEVKDNSELKQHVKDVAEIMIDTMQKELYYSRIAVEASCMTHWQKAGGDWDKTYWKNPGDKKLYE